MGAKPQPCYNQIHAMNDQCQPCYNEVAVYLSRLISLMDFDKQNFLDHFTKLRKELLIKGQRRSENRIFPLILIPVGKFRNAKNLL